MADNIFFTSPSADGYFGCFDFFTILNSAAAIDRAGRCLFFMLILFPLHIYPAVAWLDHMAVLFLILFVCRVLGIEPRTSCLPGKCSATGHSSSIFLLF